jgi:monothiol glutaredoxin
MISSQIIRTLRLSTERSLKHGRMNYAIPWADGMARISATVHPQVAAPCFPYKQQQQAFFSSDTHDDFAPKRKAVSGEEEALKMIKEHVDSNRVMLYMKGNPSMPMCGFSAKVVQVLQSEGVDFSSVNILDYPAIREGIKKFSEWPTIPQLYVNGEFIGGCDIVLAMHESGELKDLLTEEEK